MNHHVESGFYGELEMLAQKITLSRPECIVIPFIRSWVIVIQPGLADRANSGISGECRKLRNRVIRRMMHIAGMNADAGVNHWVLGVREVRSQIREARRQSDQAVDTCGARAFEKVGDFLRLETMGGKMGVGIG
jgi:hypothetical protein